MVKIYGLETSSTSVGGGVSAFYRFDSTTTIADPGEGKFRLNNATPTSVTTIAISKTDGDSFARTGIGLLRDGDAILFSATHHSISQAYELTAAPIDNTTWYSLSVTNKLTNGSFSDNDHTEVTAIFSGASAYTELSDVPQSFTGDAGKLVAVNGTESGLEHRILTYTDIPNLDASKITTGTLDTTRIPNLSANKITSDLIGTERLATGTANNTTFLRGDQTWQSVSNGATILTNNPTNNTNLSQGAFAYATATDKLWFCEDNTTGFNVWREIQWGDEFAGLVDRSYPGGTLTNNLGANNAANTTIANADILWYIGTNALTTGYTNPVDGTRITASYNATPSGLITLATDRAQATSFATNYASTDVASSWFQFYFGAYNVQITKIAIQNRGDTAFSLHRTMSIQTSADGVNFTQVTSFTASTTTGGWSTFDVAGNFSRYLRVVHTSLNSNSTNVFMVSEILLYGLLVSV